MTLPFFCFCLGVFFITVTGAVYTTAGTYTSLGLASSFGSWFGGVATDLGNAISAVAPVALPVLGALLAIGIGLKVFRKVTGK